MAETNLDYQDILQAFEQCVRECPSSTLVSYKDKKYSYAQAAYIASQIAQLLIDAKVKPGTNVAILVPRSQWYLLASLGVLTFGAAYVPIDDEFPDNRIAFMIKDTQASAILVTKDTSLQAQRVLRLDDTGSHTKLIELDNIEKDIPDSELRDYAASYKYHTPYPKDNAFIVYTSGTTGLPKAIQITRIGIVNCAQHYINISNMKKNDIYALYSSFVFDMHMVGFYASMMCGASVDIAPQEVRYDVEALNNYFVEVGATHTYLPTQIGRIFASQNFNVSLKFLLVIGEKLGEFRAPENLNMWESYGPTETLTFVTAIKVNDRKYSCSVGRPVANTKFYVLDGNQKPVPAGEIGELYIATKQISNGYLNREKENKQAFFDNPFDGDTPGYEVMYKSGDMVKILPDNTVGFIGRKDSQVKIRGNRVELSEVESCIRELDFVKDVTTTVIENNKNNILVAYVVVNDCRDDQLESVNDNKKNNNNKQQHAKITKLIVDHIASTKPKYMIPSYVEILDKIPLNVNGKVDKKALPRPTTAECPDSIIAPSTYLESQMLKYACQALEIPQNNIGINSDLRFCGLDSVSALRVTYVWKDKCNINCPAYEILKYGSVESILRHCNIADYQPIQIPYKSSSDKTLYFVHARNSSSISYTKLIAGFSGKFNFACIENYNFYHLDNPVRGYKNLAKMYVEFLRKHQKHGPYYLGGWSLGGCIAYEMAKILKDQGQEVKKLYLLDPVYAKNTLTDDQIELVAQTVNDWYFGSVWSKAITNPFSETLLNGYMSEYKGQIVDELSYCPSRYTGPVTFFKASVKSPEQQELEQFSNSGIDAKNLPQAIHESSIEKPANGFEEFINDLNIVNVETEHDNLMFEGPAKFIAKSIEQDIER